MDRSFSFSHDGHFQSTASLHDGQFSAASISVPQDLQCIASLSGSLLLNNYDKSHRILLEKGHQANPGLPGLTVTVNLNEPSMSLHLFLIVTSVTPDKLDTSRCSMLIPSSIEAT